MCRLADKKLAPSKYLVVSQRDSLYLSVRRDGTHQGWIEIAVRCRPRLGGDQAVEREVLLGAVDRGQVKGRRVAVLRVDARVQGPEAVLWQKCVYSYCLCFYPCLCDNT